MKRRLAPIAVRIERVLGRLSAPRTAGAIVPYIGYATPAHLVVRGRVQVDRLDPSSRDGQGRWRNLMQMLGLFLTREVAGVPVTADAVTVATDDEGYFTLNVPRDARSGWREISVRVGDTTATCPVLVPDKGAAFAVVSDIDDTVIQTGAYSLWRNLWTSLTGNARSRVVFPDAAALLEGLSDGGRNPVFYVSSSPWNFHGFLEQVFALNGLPRGPMFLRDFGVSEDQFITGTHGDHKGDAIDTLMAAMPDLPFVLIGDTGQHDAEVYLAAARKHPGRIREVRLRVSGPVVKNTTADAVAGIRSMGIGIDLADSFAPWSGHPARSGE